MDIQDRRVKRTQNLLAKALIALTLEKGYEAVTIRDITERADVGYATFFRHYQNKDALLRDVSDVVIDELLELLLPPQPESDPAVFGSLLFRYVEEHSAVIRVLLSSQGPASLMQYVTQTGTRKAVEESQPRPNSVVPLEIAANHLVSSSIALIRWWLEHDMPYPPERMGIIYYELIVRPTNEIAFAAPEA